MQSNQKDTKPEEQSTSYQNIRSIHDKHVVSQQKHKMHAQ